VIRDKNRLAGRLRQREGQRKCRRQKRTAEDVQRCRKWESGSETISKIERRGRPSDLQFTVTHHFQGRAGAVIGPCRDLGLLIHPLHGSPVSAISACRPLLSAAACGPITASPSVDLAARFAGRGRREAEHLCPTLEIHGPSGVFAMSRTGQMIKQCLVLEPQTCCRGSRTSWQGVMTETQDPHKDACWTLI
jgi:hypothetical protein